jgi:hypothetical protein
MTFGDWLPLGVPTVNADWAKADAADVDGDGRADLLMAVPGAS